MNEQTARDIIGQEMTADEQEILDLYNRVATLAAREDLAPCAVMCALGLCMRGGGVKSGATHGETGAGPSHKERE